MLQVIPRILPAFSPLRIAIKGFERQTVLRERIAKQCGPFIAVDTVIDLLGWCNINSFNQRVSPRPKLAKGCVLFFCKGALQLGQAMACNAETAMMRVNSFQTNELNDNLLSVGNSKMRIQAVSSARREKWGVKLK